MKVNYTKKNDFVKRRSGYGEGTTVYEQSVREPLVLIKIVLDEHVLAVVNYITTKTLLKRFV